jgi:hypothetical protein
MFRYNLFNRSINNFALDSIKIKKSFFHSTNKERFSNDVINNQNATKMNTAAVKQRKWRKYLLYSVLVPSTSAFAYYQLGLDAQGKRKVRVNVQSIGRALR